MSPLAKESSIPGISERFELFINGKELVNAYSELNDPAEQRRRFASQAVFKELGDVEALEMDAAFCDAMELGMPPTAGWGLGIDRLCMLLTGESAIREVISFPILRKL